MQCAKTGPFKSSYKQIFCEVPQCSVHAPLLFRIYINDMTQLCFFILLYWLIILTFICPTPALMFFRQLSTLNHIQFTTGLEPTKFLLITLRLTLCCYILKNTIFFILRLLQITITFAQQTVAYLCKVAPMAKFKCEPFIII